jgi:hypothetical protein
VIGALEHAEDYQAFEAAIIADYDAQSAVERELVAIAPRHDNGNRAVRNSGYHLGGSRSPQLYAASREVVYALFGRADSVGFDHDPASHGIMNEMEDVPGSMPQSVEPTVHPNAEFARCFLPPRSAEVAPRGVWPICPTTRSTGPAAMKQSFGAKSARS